MKTFMDPRPSSPKLLIQQKLENWNPPGCTFEEIQEKLAKAEERRQSMLSDVTLRASNHLKNVRQSVEEVKKQHEEKYLIVEQKLKEKELKGIEAKENQKQSLESKVFMKMEKIAFLKENKENELKKLEESLNAKVLTAAQRREQLLNEEMEKAAEANKKKTVKFEMIQEESNAKVEYIGSLQQKRLESAAERRESALSSKVEQISMSNKKKLERAQLMGHAKETVCERLKENLFDKLEAVAARKDEVMMERAAKAAITNHKVSEKVEEIKTNQMSSCLEKEIKILNKLEAASKRKDHLHDITMLERRNAEKLEKAKLINEARNAKVQMLQQALSEKIAMASEKKDFIVSSTKQRISVKNEQVARKAAEVQHIRDEEIKVLDSMLSERMAEGLRRNQEFLSKRSEKSITKVSSEDSGSRDLTETLSTDEVVEEKQQFDVMDFIQNIRLMVWNTIVSFFGRFNVRF